MIIRILMHENFYDELKVHFKNRDIKRLKEQSSQLLKEFSNGYLRGKLRIHPLGFLFCRLHHFQNNETIRIHIWSDKENAQKPNWSSLFLNKWLKLWWELKRECPFFSFGGSVILSSSLFFCGTA